MLCKNAVVGLLLQSLTTSLLLEPGRAFEANSAYKDAKLIQANVAQGVQVVHVQDYVVTRTDANVRQLQTKDRCTCRSAYDAIIPAFSVMSYDPSTKTCSLAKYIKRATYTPGATYTYTVPSSSRITKEIDGLYYYLELTNKSGFYGAQKECYERGFRLAISRNAATVTVFRKFHDANPTKEIRISLQKLEGSDVSFLRWGDNTSVDMTALSTMTVDTSAQVIRSFIIFNNRFLDDYPFESILPFLCQANFDGIAW